MSQRLFDISLAAAWPPLLPFCPRKAAHSQMVGKVVPGFRYERFFGPRFVWATIRSICQTAAMKKDALKSAKEEAERTSAVDRNSTKMCTANHAHQPVLKVRLQKHRHHA